MAVKTVTRRIELRNEGDKVIRSIVVEPGLDGFPGVIECDGRFYTHASSVRAEGEGEEARVFVYRRTGYLAVG